MKSMGDDSYDVFLCHSSADKNVVEDLARRLKDKGVKPWLDKWNLVPGEPWQSEIENALSACSACAVCVGDDRIRAPWQNEEMRAAIARRVKESGTTFRVIPVLLPNSTAAPDLPAFLVATTWVKFHDSLDDAEALHRLVCGIRGQRPGDFAAQSSPPVHTEYTIVLTGTLSNIDGPEVTAILKQLAELSRDTTLTIKRVQLRKEN